MPCRSSRRGVAAWRRRRLLPGLTGGTVGSLAALRCAGGPTTAALGGRRVGLVVRTGVVQGLLEGLVVQARGVEGVATAAVRQGQAGGDPHVVGGDGVPAGPGGVRDRQRGVRVVDTDFGRGPGSHAVDECLELVAIRDLEPLEEPAVATRRRIVEPVHVEPAQLWTIPVADGDAVT